MLGAHTARTRWRDRGASSAEGQPCVERAPHAIGCRASLGAMCHHAVVHRRSVRYRLRRTARATLEGLATGHAPGARVNRPPVMESGEVPSATAPRTPTSTVVRTARPLSTDLRGRTVHRLASMRSDGAAVAPSRVPMKGPGMGDAHATASQAGRRCGRFLRPAWSGQPRCWTPCAGRSLLRLASADADAAPAEPDEPRHGTAHRSRHPTPERT